MFLVTPKTRGGYAPPPVLTFMAFILLVTITQGQQYSYTRDCIDQHHKEVQCFVQLVQCDDDIADSSNQTSYPDSAHDIRVEPFAKAMSRRLAESYQLAVDISWQTPPNNSTKLLKGFRVEIETEDQATHLCFLFNVSESNWTSETVAASPRLHFSTENLFRFGQKYDVVVRSLPENPSKPKMAKKRVVMPHNPRLSNHTSLLSPNCSQFSHPYASKWTAGFRRIILHPLARTIQIEFVGAPAQYCFEQYEVRLLDETGLELLHSDVITVEQMHNERVDNNTVFFGQYNFTGLDLDRQYIPSVIAVERASDGRCLCPVYGTNPYDSTVVCSCIAADWKPVKLQKIKTGGYVVVNSTVPLMTVDNSDSNGWGIYLILVACIFAILTCVAFLLISAYRHYGARGKTVRIRFIQDRSRNTLSTTTSAHPGFDPSGGQGKALLETTNGNSTAIMMNGNLNLLIVYAHDSPQHEQAVLALADFLRDVFGFDVHLDAYDSDKIERNLMDYLSSSVVNADKILVVNSMGAAHRYQTKIQSVPGSAFLVEHNEPSPFDALFVQQIDMVLQHHSIVSTRFDFSQFNEVLVPLHGCLQYVLPANLAPLLSALTTSNLKNDSRLSTSHPALERLQNAITAQKAMIDADQGWFTRTHHRRRVAARQSCVGLPQQPITLLPSMSALPTLSVGGDDEEEYVVEEGTDKTPLIIQFNQEADESINGDVPEITGVVEEPTEVVPELSERLHEVPVPSVQPQTNLPETSPRIQDVQERIPSTQNDPSDSGVYDEFSHTHTISDSEEVEARLRSVSETPATRPELVGQTKLSPPNSRIEGKTWRDETLDSGMISDADLQLIST